VATVTSLPSLLIVRDTRPTYDRVKKEMKSKPELTPPPPHFIMARVVEGGDGVHGGGAADGAGQTLEGVDDKLVSVSGDKGGGDGQHGDDNEDLGGGGLRKLGGGE
jgi:hypothetical protein